MYWVSIVTMIQGLAGLVDLIIRKARNIQLRVVYGLVKSSMNGIPVNHWIDIWSGTEMDSTIIT